MKKNLVIGYVDEVGRGCLACEVVAVCVVFKNGKPDNRLGITDSKKINAKKREELLPKIKKFCHIGFGSSSVKEIDKLNILNATFLAMKRAINDVEVKIDKILVDGDKKILGLKIKQRAIIKGDLKVFGISCASIVAKVARDEMMNIYADEYPGYDFENNKGYGTKKHRDALLELGPTIHHRKQFIRKILGNAT